MAVLVIHFLEAMEIQDDQAERLAVAARAIQFLFEGFTEKSAVVETRQGIGHRVEFQLLQLVVFDEDGNTKKTGGGKDIHESRFQRDLTT